LRCHYRFYAYTRASIAFDTAQTGPAMAEETRPDPADRCQQVPVTETIPAVCSTIVWVAARKVSLENKPGLLLDPPGTRQHARPGAPCASHYTLPGHPHSNLDDGLYDYSAVDRAKAGERLYEDLEGEARDSVAAAVGLGSTGQDVRDLMRQFLPGGGFIVDWNETIMSAGIVNPIVTFLDIHRRIANITCNLFASDSSRDDDSWRNPGDGVSVSPDDIASWWQPNFFISDMSALGLYGQAVSARFRPPMTVRRPPQKWALSSGPGEVGGRVRLANDPRIPVGAHLELACRSATTNTDGVFDLAAPQGTYLLIGRWTDPGTDWVWEGSGVVKVPFWGRCELEDDLLLEGPSAGRRAVRVLFHADVVNRHTFGEDWWDHRDAADDLYLVGGENVGPHTYNNGRKTFPVEDIGIVTVDYVIDWPDPHDPTDPFAVVLSVEGTLDEHGQRKSSGAGTVVIGAGDTREVKVEVFNQDALKAPERAWITLRATNDRMG
jgi:hypothetical protein